METHPEIAVADQSALFYLMHSDAGNRVHSERLLESALPHALPLDGSISQLNVDHPLLGGRPLIAIVSSNNARWKSERIECRSCNAPLPPGSLFRLREGLIMANPEFVFARMGYYLDDYQLIQAGIDLCGRYFINVETKEIEDRHTFLTTPLELKSYLEHSSGLLGASHAKRVLHWVIPNSGSPEETRTYLQYCLPLRFGGFALPFTAMNYDVQAGRSSELLEQSNFCIDLVNTEARIGIEYDGEESHKEYWSDVRRRNELGVLGWRIFPIDKGTLYSPMRSIRFGMQMRHLFKLRNRMPQNWEEKCMRLRASIGLPV